MRRDREFFIALAPPITPAEAARFVLSIRRLYTTVYLENHGTRLQREIHERDLMYSYEDQLNLNCLVPRSLLRGQISHESISIGFLQSSDQNPELIDRTLTRMYEIVK